MKTKLYFPPTIFCLDIAIERGFASSSSINSTTCPDVMEDEQRTY